MAILPGSYFLPHSSFSKINFSIEEEIQNRLNQKTKPVGSLGKLEWLAVKMGIIQNTIRPKIVLPTLLIFAADHGIAIEGVSAYPQEVTYQMVLNFISGGAAASVLAKENNINLRIVDAGVNYDFGLIQNLENEKIGHGTQNFLYQPAMNESEVLACLQSGARIAKKVFSEGSNLLAFGEMGISNTSASSLLSQVLTGVSLHNLCGSGTGLDLSGVDKKREILEKSLKRFHSENSKPNLLDLLKNFGGFEILMMTGAMLEAASLSMIIVVDGFISTSAFLCAYFINPKILDYTIFSHQSTERGHIYQLNYLGVEPILNLGLRLGEGTGTLLAIPILRSAVAILNQMASFESAGVSNESIPNPVTNNLSK